MSIPSSGSSTWWSASNTSPRVGIASSLAAPGRVASRAGAPCRLFRDTKGSRSEPGDRTSLCRGREASAVAPELDDHEGLPGAQGDVVGVLDPPGALLDPALDQPEAQPVAAGPGKLQLTAAQARSPIAAQR